MLNANPISIYCYTDQIHGNDVTQILEQAGYVVRSYLLANTNGQDYSKCNLLVIDGTRASAEALKLCNHVRHRQAEAFVPVLFISSDLSPSHRLACLEYGADTYLLRPFDPAELLAQVQAFIRIKERHDRLTEKTEEVHRINKRLQAAYQQIDMELTLASRLQAGFLPQKLPELPNVRFAVHYRPSGRVGGDFYDVFRLDESHVGFYVADVMGHGVPASLLTIFVKKGIRAKEITGSSYRLTPPNEVLQSLNRDLIDQQLSDQPFITMLYGLLNTVTGVFQFARAGHPYPLVLRAERPPEPLRADGTLLGVFDTRYYLQTVQLSPGDKILLYTDGIEKAEYLDYQPGPDSLIAAANQFQGSPINEMVAKLAANLFASTQLGDDLTLLGVELLDVAGGTTPLNRSTW